MTQKIEIHTLNKERPLSPHLTIYKPQLTSVLSILHRITGAYLFLGILLFAWIFFSLVYFPNCLSEYFELIHNNAFLSIIFKLMLICWIFALFYHLLNGIRHLFWDMGKGFSLKGAYVSGKLVLFSSIILTLSCLIYSSISLETHIPIEETIIEIEN